MDLFVINQSFLEISSFFFGVVEIMHGESSIIKGRQTLRLVDPLLTKYTAVYATFEDQKLGGQFSEFFSFQKLEFMNFSLIQAIEFPKKKEL